MSEIEKIDEVIHGRLRLAIMAYLANAESASFNELMDALGASKGNLSVQIRKLEDAGYIDVDKRIVARKTLTTCRLTKEGKAAFRTYLDNLTSMLGLPTPEQP